MPKPPKDILLKKIELTNFRAFHGAGNTIDLADKKSLIVLGENGSGKSSLFFALRDFFTLDKNGMDINAVPFRNIFASTAETGVKIHFSDGGVYEWSNVADTFPALAAKGVDTTKGFIDYKSLLQTYYGQQRENIVNIFDFLVKEILADIKPLGSAQTVGAMWRDIAAARPDKRRRSEVNALTRQIEEFNTALSSIINPPTAINSFQTKTQEILDLFGLNLEIEINFGGISYNPKFTNDENIVINQIINLIVDFYKSRQNNHHQFLNEARLSAIAISLFFASFQIQPAGRIRLLTLDDVLIGLDMQNRLPVLDILERYFADYQVFLFTFDNFWFENVKAKFPHFQRLEIHSLRNPIHESVAVKTVKSYLERAEDYYNNGEKDTAANYVRKAYEKVIKDFCDRKRLKTTFRYNQGKIPASDFWSAIVSTSNNFSLTTTLKRDIEAYQSNINNPLSHDGIHNVHSSEVGRAIDKVKALLLQL